MDGWIKLHRKFNETAFKRKPLIVALFIHLLTNANHKQSKMLWNGEEMIVEAGQLVTGRLSLSEQTGLSQQSVRTALVILKSTNTITIKTTTKFSVITICKWKEYQMLTNGLTNNQPTTNQQLTTNKNDKNVINILPKGNMTSPLPKKSPDKEIELIISSYKKNMGFNPTDRKPRFVAYNLKRNIETFITAIHEKRPDITFDGALDKTWEWYMKKDDLKGNTLDAFRRKAKMLFDKTLAKEGVSF